MRTPLNLEQFLADVAEHQMTVLRDDGLYRHLRFAKPGTSYMSFDVITWPWHLCYAGDLGTFVFARVADMFQFFRQDAGRRPNLDYWAEKVEATDKSTGIKVFSAEWCKAKVREWFDDYAADLTPDAKADLWARVENEVFTDAEGQETAIRAAIADVQDGKNYPFQNFWEVDCTVYTLRYEWCGYALPWAIRQYDAAIATGPAAEVA